MTSTVADLLPAIGLRIVAGPHQGHGIGTLTRRATRLRLRPGSTTRPDPTQENDA